MPVTIAGRIFLSDWQTTRCIAGGRTAVQGRVGLRRIFADLRGNDRFVTIWQTPLLIFVGYPQFDDLVDQPTPGRGRRAESDDQGDRLQLVCHCAAPLRCIRRRRRYRLRELRLVHRRRAKACAV